MSFIVSEDREYLNCVVHDGNGFRLTVTHPRDIHRVWEDGRILQYGYEHFVRIQPEGRFLDKDVAKTPLDLRNCCMEDECNTYTNPGPYSQSQCLSTCQSEFIFRECSCTTFDSNGSPDRKLCDLDEYKCFLKNLEKFYASENKLCKTCLPNCNDIRYSVEITSVPLLERVISNIENIWSESASDKSEYAVVHVFYGVGAFQVTVTKRRRLFSELIGIITGMFGSAVELTLPKIMDFCYILIGILATTLALCWRKSQPCRRRIGAMLTRARRLFQSRQIDPDVSIIPLQILVTSRTNLTNSEENGEHFE